MFKISDIIRRLRVRYGSMPNPPKPASFLIVLAIPVCVWCWRHFRDAVRSADKATWVDICLGTALLAIVPFALAAYGGHVAAETITDPGKQRAIKVKFWSLFVIGVLLAFLQQYRSITTDEKNRGKAEGVEGHIVGLLEDLRKPGTMTEAERRRKILDVLQQQYVITHEVDQRVIDGLEPPPADWVNGQLKALGENWSVSGDAPRPIRTNRPNVALSTQSYCPPAPSGPRIREDGDPFCEFNDGELTAWTDNIVSRLDETVKLYEQETFKLDHGPGRSTDMARLIPNIHLKDTYSQCCYSWISPLRAELIKRLPGGSTVEPPFPLSNPSTWPDLGQEPHTIELEMASMELKQLNNQLKAKIRAKQP